MLAAVAISLVSIAGGYIIAWSTRGEPAAPVALAAPAENHPPSPSILNASSDPSQPHSRPSTQPARYPSDQLIKDTREAGRKLQTRLDSSFHVLTFPPFVVAGNLPEDRIRQYAQWSILRPAEALWKSYFQVRGQEVITVLLLADEASYRGWAKKLFKDEDVSYYGYYRHNDRTLVMNIGTGTGTLVHELTHALIVYDWPNVPLWFNEGLASLHEQCQVHEDHITGLPNWRLPGLQKAISDGRLRSLADLAGKGDFYGPLRGLNYAHARYFCLYLQQRGLLKEFYQKYQAGFAKGIPPAKVMTEVAGLSLPDLDAQLQKFVQSLRFPGDAQH